MKLTLSHKRKYVPRDVVADEFDEHGRGAGAQNESVRSPDWRVGRRPLGQTVVTPHGIANIRDPAQQQHEQPHLVNDAHDDRHGGSLFHGAEDQQRRVLVYLQRDGRRPDDSDQQTTRRR